MNATILKLHESQLDEIFKWLSVNIAQDDAGCDNYRWSWQPSKPFDVPLQDYQFFFRDQRDHELFEMRWK